MTWTSEEQVGFPRRCHMAQVFGDDGQSLAFIEPTDPPTIASDRARLIAAAPDMLAALRVIADLHSQSRPDDIQDAIDAANGAIAKAEGQS